MKSRKQKQKAKHRTGLLKKLEQRNAPHRQQKNKDSFKEELNALADRMGMPRI